MLFGPKVNDDIEQTIGVCETCQKYRSKQSKEPMWVEENNVLKPWGKDLFALDGKNYVLLMDYYSHYPESFAEGHYC